MGLFKKKIVKKTYDREHMKPVIRASICTGEEVAGFKDIRTGKIEEIINNNILNKYRIPGAHTGYIPYSKACEARKYVLESLLELEKYFMMKGDVM